MAGCVIGAIISSARGHTSGRYISRMGLNFAITSGLFAGFEESIFRLRGERDFFNRIYGGAATGVLIGSYIGVVLFFFIVSGVNITYL